LLSISAFGWLGWKLVARNAPSKHSAYRTQQKSDRIAATLRLILVEHGARPGAWAVTPSLFEAKHEDGFF
jgi:hypothetical protein